MSKESNPSPKSGRVDVRTTQGIRNISEQAATPQGLVRHLSDCDRDLFLNLLDDPPAPNEALRAAANDFKQAVQSGFLLL